MPPSSVIPAKAGTQNPPSDAFTVAWRKPVFPAHMKALAGPRPNDGAKTRAAQTFITRALAAGPRPAAEVEREAALTGISKATLVRARALCRVKAFRVGTTGTHSGAGAWYWSLPDASVQQDVTPAAPAELVNG